MSWVTNVIISLEILDHDEAVVLKRINEYFLTEKVGFGKIIDSHKHKMIGGNKHIEANIAIGAFNKLNVNELISHIRSISSPLSGPKSIQLLTQDQEESFFNSHIVIDEGWD